MNTRPVGGRSSETLSHAIDMNKISSCVLPWFIFILPSNKSSKYCFKMFCFSCANFEVSYTGTKSLIRNSENRKAPKTESFFMEVDSNLNTTVTMTTMTTLMYPLLQDPQARCNVPLLNVYVQVYSSVWACLCLKFYWMFCLEIKSTLVILWSVFVPFKINNAMNNIYQLVLITCAILSLSSWPPNPSDYHSEIRKIPISEKCLVPRVSDKILYTCNMFFLFKHFFTS
jgi:hypothetical protein